MYCPYCDEEYTYEIAEALEFQCFACYNELVEL